MQRYNRQRNRIRNDLKYDDAPDSVLGGEYAREKIRIDYPVLIMLYQNGNKINNISYFWPVLVMPKTCRCKSVMEYRNKAI